MFLLSASGRLFRTKVAMVSVGAGAVNQPVTRWLFNTAARLAFYRSYREPGAREAMRQRGLDVSRDQRLPGPGVRAPGTVQVIPVDEQTVAVGVMAYHGTNDEREQADEIYARYVDGMKRFVRWLVDNGRRVGSAHRRHQRLRWPRGAGDTGRRAGKSGPISIRPVSWPQPVTTYADVMQALLPVGSVVAIRYHNVLCALKLCKPTIGISYSPKHDALMAEMGLPEFCMAVNALDVSELIKLFTELESRSAELRQTMIRAQRREDTAYRRPLRGAVRRAVPARRAVARWGSARARYRVAHTREMAMSDAASRKGMVPEADVSERASRYKKDFWEEENLKFGEPWYRLEKSARIISRLAGGRRRTLLDVGCGRPL